MRNTYAICLLVLTACPAGSLPAGDLADCAPTLTPVPTAIEIVNMRDAPIYFFVGGCAPPFDVVDGSGERAQSWSSNACETCPESCDGGTHQKLDPGSSIIVAWDGQRRVPFVQPEDCQCEGMECEALEELEPGDYSLSLRFSEDPCPDGAEEGICDCDASQTGSCTVLAGSVFENAEVIGAELVYPPISSEAVVLTIN